MLARHVRNLAQLHALRAAGIPRAEWAQPDRRAAVRASTS